MKKKLLLAIATILILVTALLFSTEPLVNKVNTYFKYVNGVTKQINPDGIIKVQLTNSYDTTNLQLLNVFTLYPSAKGKAYWLNTNTLAFKPLKPLKHRHKYKVKVDLQRVINAEKKLKPMVFNLITNGQNIKNFSCDFNKTDDKYKYFGQIQFELNTNIENLKKAVNLTLDDNKININFTKVDNKTYKFTTNNINITNKGLIVFELNKKYLSLKQNFKHQKSIYASYKMQAIYAKYNVLNQNIVISFSQDIKNGFDVKPYISITPKLNYSLYTVGKKITINTPLKSGTNYTVTVKKGVKNNFDLKTESDKTFKVFVKDKKPRVVFDSDGYILPSKGNKKIRFKSINVKKVKLQILKVYANNIGQFLQGSRLDSPADAKSYYYDFDRVGKEIYNKEIDLKHKKNTLVNHEIDLNTLIKGNPKGIFVVKLSFNKKDIIYNNPSDNDYYSPNRYGYYYRFAEVSKTLVFSDIALSCTSAKNKLNVTAINVLTAKPISGCDIKVYNYQLQVIGKDDTNRKGFCSFDDVKNPFYIEAEDNDNYAYLKLNSVLNFSSFDIKGATPDSKQNSVFMYTERGVYRPGDTINFSFMLKKAIKQGVPFGKIKIYNPQNTLIAENKLTNILNNMAVYTFKTSPEFITGSYRIEFDSGYAKKHWYFEIQTVVAEKLSLKYKKTKQYQNYIPISLKANWLFGAVASNLKVNINTEYKTIKPDFEKNYIFTDESVYFSTVYGDNITGFTNDEGVFEHNIQIPVFNNAPSTLAALIKGEVIQPGGRASKQNTVVKVYPYNYYCGINIDKSSLKTGKKADVKLIVCDKEGNKTAGKNLQFNVYRSVKWWWWEYDSYNQYLKHYKQDTETELVKTVKFVSGNKAITQSFTPEKDGFYMVELINQDDKNHKACVYFNVGSWGSNRQKDSGQLKLTTNKASYLVNEDAYIKVDAPLNSYAYVNIENKYNIISSYYFKIKKESDKTIKIPIKKEYIPNIYCNVNIVKPYKNIQADTPVRTYGIVPIKVSSKSTVLPIKITAKDSIKPNSKFNIEVQTKNHLPANFTVAVVDEGLLSLTNFATPNPHSFFFKKIAVLYKYIDNFAHIINIPKGDVLQVLKPGGGYEMAMQKAFRKQQNSPIKTDRFKPVAMFKGPIKTNKNGYAKLSFDMPFYLGQVRVMVVGSTNSSYGHASKDIIVKSKVMPVATLPKKLSIGDEFILPIEVFADNENIKSAKISVNTSGAINSINQSKTVYFDDTKTASVSFKLKAKNQIGIAKVTIKAVDDKNNSIQNTVNIAVNPASARVYDVNKSVFKAGTIRTVKLQNKGILQKNTVVATTHFVPDLSKKINYLISYPYGGLESTVSSAFVLLFIDDFNKQNYVVNKDFLINNGVQKLNSFFANGWFNYWQNSYNSYDSFADTYAGDFLYQANSLGYYINKNMFNNWQQSKISKVTRFKSINNKDKKYFNHIYSLYVLAKCGKNIVSELNYLYENELNKLTHTESWLLAATYSLLSDDETANSIITAKSLTSKPTAVNLNYKYNLQDKAFVLLSLTQLNAKTAAKKMFDDIALELSNSNIYSTNQITLAIMALAKAKAKFFDSNNNNLNADMFIDGKKIKLSGKYFSKEIKNDNAEIKIVANKNSDDFKFFVKQNYFPVNFEGKKTSNKLGIKRMVFDENNTEVAINSLQQGKVYTLKFIIENSNNLKLKKLALIQVLPACWEISQKTSMQGKAKYSYNNSYESSFYANFANFTDDKAMWFFDMYKDTKTVSFEVKIRAVTKGNFSLPGVVCESIQNPSIKTGTEYTKTKVR